MSARVAGACAVALGFAVAGQAKADVFSITSDTALTASPFTVKLGGPNVSYQFTLADTGGNGPGAAVATAGTAQVASFLGLTDFEAGSSIDQTGELYTFAAFPAATLIPNSAADDFIGLAFTLGDGVHYGYAEVSGPELVSYGFETTPGATILTGASPAVAVPEPATVMLLAAGLAGLTGVSTRRRTRRG